MRTFAIFATTMILVSLLSAQPAQDVVVKNTSSFIGKGRWQWTLYVDAKQDVLEKIKCVEYTLHATFPNPIQVVCESGPNAAQAFPLPGDAWGEFDVRIKVTFTDRPTQSYVYRLRLAPPSDQPHSVRFLPAPD
jgi:transcription initiation factor IIF auxiliary subunit